MLAMEYDHDGSRGSDMGSTRPMQCVPKLKRGAPDHELLPDACEVCDSKYLDIFEHAPIGIFRSTFGGRLIDSNEEAARILGYSSPENVIAAAKRKSGMGTFYVDPDMRREIVDRALSSNGEWIETEVRLRHNSGKVIDVRMSFRKVPAEAGEPGLLEGYVEDITERKTLEVLLRLQRDVAIAIGSASSLNEAMEQLLQSVIQIDGIDAGGVYVLDSNNEELRLVSHIGLSPWFVDEVSRYGAGTPQMRLVMNGDPVYAPDIIVTLDISELLAREGITSLAVIPIRSRGQVVAVLSLASRTVAEFSDWTKKTMESLTAGIGGLVACLVAEDALRMKSNHLAESNAALNVLLRKRDEDRRGLEETFLSDIGIRVIPYLEKLEKFRLSPEQQLLVNIAQVNLKEIAAPFLKTISRQFANLTPMEIRVAALIQSGKTTKEAAHILGTSLDAVRFHRYNLRAKLGLNGKKVNLQLYLSSLTDARY
jgi:PAS domain S-box-containing protein